MNPSSELPLVSIITPSFNQARYLEQTIQSVLGQGYVRLEYLLVDGASTDGSLEIIHKYAEQFEWWVSEPDAGQAEAINKGLNRAKGKYVAWLNSDDIYLPGAIEKAVEVFEGHPEVGMVFGDVIAIDQNGQTTNRLRYGEWSLRDLMAFRVIGQPSVFMRRSVLEQTGTLDLSYHYLLDHQLWLRLAQIADIRYLPETLSAARFHAESKNVALAVKFGEEAFRILAWMENQSDLATRFAENRRRIRAGAYRLRAFYLQDGGDAPASLRAYGRALRLHPPSVLRDWMHVLSAFMSLLGLNKLGQVYKKVRKRLS